MDTKRVTKDALQKSKQENTTARPEKIKTHLLNTGEKASCEVCKISYELQNDEEDFQSNRCIKKSNRSSKA